VTELDQLPFAKPERRITDRKALESYARQHPCCEVMGCKARRSQLETHHIKSRKMGGSDISSNLLRLCGFGGHHTEFHTVGGREWFRRYESRLPEDARAKIAAALRIEAQP
jgi:5-methylcytosine-specific restriction endonuclease McrA